MNNHSGDAVGVDISKTHLDAWQPGGAKRFGNDAKGFEEFAAWVAPADAVVVYESTGHYHRDFEEALAGRLRLARVNAARARRFAQALGEEAKTDAVDARVLAAMGAALPLRLVEARSSAQRDLDELGTARDGLVKERVAALNRREHLRDPLLKRQNRNRLAQIDRHLRAVDARIGELLAADPAPRCCAPSPASARSPSPDSSPTCRNWARSTPRPRPAWRGWRRWRASRGTGRAAATSRAAAAGCGGFSTWRR